MTRNVSQKFDEGGAVFLSADARQSSCAFSSRTHAHIIVLMMTRERKCRSIKMWNTYIYACWYNEATPCTILASSCESLSIAAGEGTSITRRTLSLTSAFKECNVGCNAREIYDQCRGNNSCAAADELCAALSRSMSVVGSTAAQSPYCLSAFRNCAFLLLFAQIGGDSWDTLSAPRASLWVRAHGD